MPNKENETFDYPRFCALLILHLAYKGAKIRNCFDFFAKDVHQDAESTAALPNQSPSRTTSHPFAARLASY